MLDVLSSLVIPQNITTHTDSYVSLTFHLQNSFLMFYWRSKCRGVSDLGGGGLDKTMNSSRGYHMQAKNISPPNLELKVNEKDSAQRFIEIKTCYLYQQELLDIL